MTTSRLVLGAMMFGTTIDETTSFALLDRFVDAGGEWIDTADCYSFWASDSGYGGDSEELLGRWLAARPGARERVKIATKFGAEPRVAGDWPRTVCAPPRNHHRCTGSAPPEVPPPNVSAPSAREPSPCETVKSPAARE